MTNTPVPDNYDNFLRSLKERIRTAQVRAALAVNKELVLLYWQIGKEILERQSQEGWGAKVIGRLAKDLKAEFPEMKGFSSRNINYMRAFADTYPDEQIVQQLVAQIPWGHNVRILDSVKSQDERIWYIQQTIENGWSRAVMEHQIETKLYQRQGKAITNFDQALPQPQSELAQQILKSPYNFDFLSLGKEAQERDLERALIAHMRDFLLELGVGFSFVGSQYALKVAEQEFRIDLLFYHLKLRCFIVIDLKMGKFEPAYSGQINFYVNAVDDLLRHPDDQPTIGLVLCKSKENTIVEYSLRGISTPIGVSTHSIEQLPEQLQESLPTVERLQQELNEAAAEIEAKSSNSEE
ncbi:YhcG family protein [Pleurocapsa sp. PCC 7319]|uniref:PDDEXK nuclease domain-containing protein n=1 Tax=Pleurocapsa sp. PCC 7319 TaxID=118161 RepID=UPI00034A4388|nr:PDDEXK nuclease domain-containing protein [Pleurocapsa sp. PCC 7319]